MQPRELALRLRLRAAPFASTLLGPRPAHISYAQLPQQIATLVNYLLGGARATFHTRAARDLLKRTDSSRQQVLQRADNSSIYMALQVAR